MEPPKDMKRQDGCGKRFHKRSHKTVLMCDEMNLISFLMLCSQSGKSSKSAKEAFLVKNMF